MREVSDERASTSTHIQNFKFLDSLLFRAVPCPTSRQSFMPEIWSDGFCHRVSKMSKVLKTNIKKTTAPLRTLLVKVDEHHYDTYRLFNFPTEKVKEKDDLRLQEISDCVDLQLGFAGENIKNGKRHVFLMVKELRQPANSGRRVTINMEVVGFLEAVSIQYGHRIDSCDENCSSARTCEEKEHAAKVGISRIWTSIKFRRMNIATIMLDECCKYLEITKNDIAFSELTTDLMRFLKFYYASELCNIFLYFPDALVK